LQKLKVDLESALIPLPDSSKPIAQPISGADGV
jgi:hypothetical protein